MLQLKSSTSVPFYEPWKRKITWQHPGRKMAPGGKQIGCRQRLPTTFASFKGSLYMGLEFKLWTLRHLCNFYCHVIDRAWLSDPQLGSWRELVGLGSQKKMIIWFWSFLLFPNCSSVVSAKPWTWLIILETNANLAWPPLHFWEVIKCQIKLSFHWLWLSTKISQFMSKVIFHQVFFVIRVRPWYRCKALRHFCKKQSSWCCKARDTPGLCLLFLPSMCRIRNWCYETPLSLLWFHQIRPYVYLAREHLHIYVFINLF